MAEQQIPAVVMEEVTDPEELAKARAQRERFDRNSAWLQAHAAEVYTHYRGQCICIAGEELFVNGSGSSDRDAQAGRDYVHRHGRLQPPDGQQRSPHATATGRITTSSSRGWASITVISSRLRAMASWSSSLRWSTPCSVPNTFTPKMVALPGRSKRKLP